MKIREANTYQVDVRCPHCMRKGKFRMQTLLDTANAPETVEAVMKGDVFSYTCPHCGAVQYMSFTCLYHDGANKLLIGCADTPQSYAEMEKQLSGEMSDTRLNTALKGWIASCTTRLVCNPGELQEMVLIHHLGLDDRIITLIKSLLLNEAGIKDEYAMFNTDGETYVISAVDAQGNEVNLPFTSEEYEQVREKAEAYLGIEQLSYDEDWADTILVQMKGQQ